MNKREQPLEGCAIVKVFSGMELEADIHTRFIEGIQDGQPPLCQLAECLLDQPGGTLRPWIKIGPCKRTRKSGVGGQSKILAGACGEQHLRVGPLPSSGFIAANMVRRECIELGVVCGMDGDQLALKMRRQLGDLQAFCRKHAANFIAIADALSSLGEIEEPQIRSRQLHCLEAQSRCPLRDGRQGVEWCGVAHKLRQENTWTLNGLHVNSLGCSSCPQIAASDSL